MYIKYKYKISISINMIQLIHVWCKTKSDSAHERCICLYFGQKLHCWIVTASNVKKSCQKMFILYVYKIET